MSALGEFKPLGRFRRALDGADFSLEANTKSAPEPDRFYVFRAGRVIFNSEDYGEAAQVYRDLCRQHWEGQLNSADPEERLAGAWGLLGLDPEHATAMTVIREDGDAGARKQLEQLRRRRQSQQRGAARKKGPAS